MVAGHKCAYTDVAVRCSGLQCVAVCCRVLQCVDRRFSKLWWLGTGVLILMLQCVAVCWQCVAVCCSVLQCVAVCCSVLQCVVKHVALKSSWGS